jgi:DNA-binding transcriptional LysR family regulator
MIRNLDTAALRALVTIADTGGVTRAAGVLNLTQSAVSMQVKRLEEALAVALLERTGRGVQLTGPGEMLVALARQMLSLNDEAVGRLMRADHAGTITLGVPHDIVTPVIPRVLRDLSLAFPRLRVQLVSSFTRPLMEQHARGELHVILTTETETGPGGRMLAELPLVWVGAPGGVAWQRRPLPLAFERRCIFRTGVLAALAASRIPSDMVVEADSTRTVEATVMADLAVHAMLAGSAPATLAEVDHGGGLPALPAMRVNLYAPAEGTPPMQALVAMLAQGFGAMQRPPRAALFAE